MKIIVSKRNSHRWKFPLGSLGRAYEINFENYRALVPDHIAEHVQRLDPNQHFYTVENDFSGLSQPGGTVLVIRDTGLGDVLLTTPLLRALSVDYKLIVHFATNADWLPLFNKNPYVAKALDLNAYKAFDAEYVFKLDLRLVVENAEATRQFDHRVDAFGKTLDLDLSKSRVLDYYMTAREESWGKRVLKPYEGFKVAYVWTASTENRSWPVAKHRQALQALVDDGMTPVLLGRDKSTIEQTSLLSSCCDFTSDLTVRETAAVMKNCDAVLTPDTGLLHLAAAIDCPTVCYWGAFPMTERSAFRDNVPFADLTNRDNCARVPCRAYGCWNQQREQLGFSPCLSISPAEIVSKLRSVASVSK